MMESEHEQEELYYVVKNVEEQYSIWPSYKQVPKGWETIGSPKIKSECLTYIEENWTDMRPLSLRKQMDGNPTIRNLDH
jgi:MbtH protein